VLLVIIMRQITPALLGDGGAQPPTSVTTTPPVAGNGDTGATSTPDGAQVEFIFPPKNSEINFGDNVSGSVNVAGLGSDTLWIISRHDVGGSH
jgi:hypothetical protein